MTTPSAKDFTEYVIKIKDETKSLSEKHITYEPFLLSKGNQELSEQVNDLWSKFDTDIEKKESPEITVRAKMVWQY